MTGVGHRFSKQITRLFRSIQQRTAKIRKTIDHLGISQLGIARLFGEKPRTIRRWIAGDSRIPSTAVILIRALSLGDLTKEQIEQLRD